MFCLKKNIVFCDASGFLHPDSLDIFDRKPYIFKLILRIDFILRKKCAKHTKNRNSLLTSSNPMSFNTHLPFSLIEKSTATIDNTIILISKAYQNTFHHFQLFIYWFSFSYVRFTLFDWYQWICMSKTRLAQFFFMYF